MFDIFIFKKSKGKTFADYLFLYYGGEYARWTTVRTYQNKPTEKNAFVFTRWSVLALFFYYMHLPLIWFLFIK